MDFKLIKYEDIDDDNAFENTDLYGADTSHEVYKNSYLGRKNIYHDHEWMKYLKNKWHFDYAEGIYYKQKPGQMVAPHVDKHTSFTARCPFDFKSENISRYIVFLSDWHIGQTWMLGKSSLTNWKKFDVIKFPWYMPHATANVSTQDRELLTICAICN